MTTGAAHALGFGRVVSATQLGQRLNFAALVRLDPDESLDRPCVHAEVMAGDNLLQPGQVRVTLEGGPDTPDRTVRVTTSAVIEEPVVTVTVSVGCGSRATRRFVVFIDPPGIPLAQASPDADSALLLPQRTESQVAPLLAIVDPGAAERRDGAVRPRGPSSVAAPRPARSTPVTGAADPLRPTRQHRLVSAVPGPVALAEVARARRPAPARRPGAADSHVARSSGGGRLQLDPPVARAAQAPDPGASAPRSVAVAEAPPGPAASAAARAASATDPQTEALARAEQQRRLQSLEDGMARMRADAVTTQKALVALQARLQAAESERQPGPLTLALALLSGVLAAILVALLWRRSRPSGSALWWAGSPVSVDGADRVEPARDALVTTVEAAAPATLPVARPARAPVEDLPYSTVDVSLPGLTVTSPSWSASPGPPGDAADDAHAVVVSAAAPLAGEAGRVGSGLHASDSHLSDSHLSDSHLSDAHFSDSHLPDPHLPNPKGPDRPASERALSVEELIDLEQQAEFFVVLGQDDAAIDLLTQHARADGGASPLPYLKLLEIHRRREDRDGYEAIRASFNERFNAYAPDWDADLQHGRTLEDYPEVVERLQRLWTTPSRAMETLDASVFRRSRSDATFDLPAYRELLFLYTIARDQAEQPAAVRGGAFDRSEQVDLLLPLGAVEGQADPIAHLSASGNGRRLPTDDANDEPYTRPLDLDVTLAPERVKAEPAPRPKVTAARRAAPATAHYEGAETVPAALRRPVGYPDESAYVDLELEPAGPGGHASVR